MLLNNLHFLIINDTLVVEDNMLDWHLCQTCYPDEIKLLVYCSQKVGDIGTQNILENKPLFCNVNILTSVRGIC